MGRKQKNRKRSLKKKRNVIEEKADIQSREATLAIVLGNALGRAIVAEGVILGVVLEIALVASATEVFPESALAVVATEDVDPAIGNGKKKNSRLNLPRRYLQLSHIHQKRKPTRLLQPQKKT